MPEKSTTPLGEAWLTSRNESKPSSPRPFTRKMNAAIASRPPMRAAHAPDQLVFDPDSQPFVASWAMETSHDGPDFVKEGPKTRDRDFKNVTPGPRCILEEAEIQAGYREILSRRTDSSSIELPDLDLYPLPPRSFITGLERESPLQTPRLARSRIPPGLEPLASQPAAMQCYSSVQTSMPPRPAKRTKKEIRRPPSTQSREKSLSSVGKAPIPAEKKVAVRRCTRCREVGHNRSNKMCPLYGLDEEGPDDAPPL